MDGCSHAADGRWRASALAPATCTGVTRPVGRSVSIRRGEHLVVKLARTRHEHVLGQAPRLICRPPYKPSAITCIAPILASVSADP